MNSKIIKLPNFILSFAAVVLILASINISSHSKVTTSLSQLNNMGEAYPDALLSHITNWNNQEISSRSSSATDVSLFKSRAN